MCHFNRQVENNSSKLLRYWRTGSGLAKATWSRPALLAQ
jgi:hypothetical protein